MVEDKIKNYLAKCAPHVKKREAAKLLAEAEETIIYLRGQLQHEQARSVP